MTKRAEQNHDAATIEELRRIAQECQDRGDKRGQAEAENRIQKINEKRG